MQTPAYMRWLPADALKKIARLEFLAHGAVEGFVAGRHRSSRKGASAEFAEHRAYMPGDDLRKLDWKLLARRQRLYVREYVDETNLRATVLLDTSGSMSFAGDLAAGGLTKFDYARHVASLLAYLLIRQQDAVGLVTFDHAVNVNIGARSQPGHLRQLLEKVDALEPGGETDLAPVLHEVAERIPRRSVVFLVSDLLGDPDAILSALHHFRFRHHEVVVLHVVDEAELTFPYSGALSLEDAESPALLNIDAEALRRDYLRRVGDYLAKLRRGCGEMSVVHELLSTRVPYDDALADVLLRYHAGGGRR